MDEAQENTRVAGTAKLRRIAHPWRVTLWALVLTAALAASFLAGRLLQAPERDQLSSAQQDLSVLAPVERRIVDTRTSHVGKVVEGAHQSLTMTSLPELAVVTRQALAPGDLVTSGALVGAVSGRPVFGLSGPLALYRDLTTGDVGDDVKILQEALRSSGFNVATTGRVDWQTTVVINRLFTGHGFPPLTDQPNPGSDSGNTGMTSSPRSLLIPRTSFIALGAPGSTVVAAALVGSAVTAETPLATVKVQPNFVSFRADAAEASELAAGQDVTLEISGQQIPGTIETVGDFSAGSDGQIPGRDVSATSSTDEFSRIKTGTSVTIRPTDELNESLAVPLIAIKQDGSGTFVLRATAGTNGATNRPNIEQVRVSIKSSGNGWAALEEGPLEESDKVVVQ